MSAGQGSTARGTLTYCAVSRLGFVPVVGREVVESTEDVLAGDTCEGGWRVGSGDEGGGGGRRGHGYLEELAGTGRVRGEGAAVIRQQGEPIVRSWLVVSGFGRKEPTCRSSPLHKKGRRLWSPGAQGGNPQLPSRAFTTIRSPDRYCFGSSEPLPEHNPFPNRPRRC